MTLSKKQKKRLDDIAKKGKARIDVIHAARKDEEPGGFMPPGRYKVNYHAMKKGKLS